MKGGNKKEKGKGKEIITNVKFKLKLVYRTFFVKSKIFYLRKYF